MRLAWKVFLSTSLVMVVLVGIAAWSLRAVNEFVHVNATIIERSVPALRLETSLRESMLSMLRLESRWAVLRDPGYAAHVAGELYGGSAREDPIVARDLLHATTRLGPARGYYYQLISILGWTSLPRLPRLRPPTLILAGDDDPIIPVVNARIMHRLIRRSTLHVYQGGHLELAADPERLASAVQAFLDADLTAEESQP